MGLRSNGKFQIIVKFRSVLCVMKVHCDQKFCQEIPFLPRQHEGAGSLLQAITSGIRKCTFQLVRDLNFELIVLLNKEKQNTFSIRGLTNSMLMDQVNGKFFDGLAVGSPFKKDHGVLYATMLLHRFDGCFE